MDDIGIWLLLVLVAFKFVTGVFVAWQRGEFKWFYLDHVFIRDILKIAAYAVVVGVQEYNGVVQFNNEPTRLLFGLVLVIGLLAGVIKNLGHIFPKVGDRLPSEFREPARLRLGNPKNLP
jgi:hypothetical protein